MHPQFAGGGGWHFKIADPQVDDGAGRAGGLAAAVAGLDQYRVRLLRHPQGLDRERGQQLVLVEEYQRRSAQYAVGVTDNAQRTQSGGGLLQLRQGLHGSPILFNLSAGWRPEHRHAGRQLDRIAALLVQQEEAADHRGQGKAVGQQVIIVGQAGKRACQLGIALRLWQARGNLAGRCPVGFGKNDVEGDGRGARVGQSLRQPGNLGPRPWPLPQPFDRFLVNVDNPHARVLIGARRGGLVAVKDHQAQTVKARKGRKLQRCNRENHQHSGDDRTGLQHRQPAAGRCPQIPDPQSHVTLIAPPVAKLQGGRR